MLEKGVYVIGFLPVVPHGTARIRTQVSAAHSRDLEFAVNAFAETNEELK
jgi:glycine C-acetyltransferase